HFDFKAEHEDLARSLGIPSTFVHVPAYFEMFMTFFPPRPAGDGTYVTGFPQGDTPMASMSVEDVGLIVAPIFEQPEKYIGRTLKLAAEELPAAAYAEIMSRATGATIRYEHVPREVFAALGFRGAEDLADMWEYYRYHIPSRLRDIETCRAIAPGMQSFETWVARNTGKLRALLGHVQAA
ncbi:MAG TPA: NmrA family NAD(P)-binding protein, partial [Thermoanaerobaculia bacterium]|nr:NmrA family NAD(P)-binding protein [Thermoanaerobaculia bacterium]